MKRRWVWRWTLTYSDGSSWFGTCSEWAAQPLPSGAVLERERVLYIGPLEPCMCGSRHAPLVASGAVS